MVLIPSHDGVYSEQRARSEVPNPKNPTVCLRWCRLCGFCTWFWHIFSPIHPLLRRFNFIGSCEGICDFLVRYNSSKKVETLTKCRTSQFVAEKNLKPLLPHPNLRKKKRWTKWRKVIRMKVKKNTSKKPSGSWKSKNTKNNLKKTPPSRCASKMNLKDLLRDTLNIKIRQTLYPKRILKPQIDKTCGEDQGLMTRIHASLPWDWKIQGATGKEGDRSCGLGLTTVLAGNIWTLELKVQCSFRTVLGDNFDLENVRKPSTLGQKVNGVIGNFLRCQFYFSCKGCLCPAVLQKKTPWWVNVCPANRPHSDYRRLLSQRHFAGPGRFSSSFAQM